MTLCLASDLHLEHNRDIEALQFAEADVLLIAGDIIPIELFDEPLLRQPLEWLRRGVSRFERCFGVLGNHEFYSPGLRRSELRKRAKEKFGELGIEILDDESAEHRGVRFIGSTLWSDFRNNDPMIKLQAWRRIADFECIQSDDGRPESPDDQYERYRHSLKWLLDTVESRDVVMTHYSPVFDSTHERFRTDGLTYAFVGNGERVLRKNKPRLWHHGHMHNQKIHRFGSTDVVVHAYGYEASREPTTLSIQYELCR